MLEVFPRGIAEHKANNGEKESKGKGHVGSNGGTHPYSRKIRARPGLIRLGKRGQGEKGPTRSRMKRCRGQKGAEICGRHDKRTTTLAKRDTNRGKTTPEGRGGKEKLRQVGKKGRRGAESWPIFTGRRPSQSNTESTNERLVEEGR